MGLYAENWPYAIGNFYNVHNAAYNLPQSSTVEERFSEDDTTLRNLTLVPSNCSIIIIFCFVFFRLDFPFFFSVCHAMFSYTLRANCQRIITLPNSHHGTTPQTAHEGLLTYQMDERDRISELK